MVSQNEFYFKAQLLSKIEEFLSEELGDHDLGYIPDNIAQNMTEAAWLIIVANKDLNNYFEREKISIFK